MPEAVHFTKPFRRVLVATDFSATSEAARDHALALSAPGALVAFLHATALPIPESAPQPTWLPDGASPRAELMACLRTFAEPATRSGHVVQLLLENGLPAETILTATAAMHADLVVLGTHGRRGFVRLMGSTAQHVLRQCSVPVLTASSSCDRAVAGVKRILCAVGTTVCASTVSFAERLAKSSGASLTYVHVLPPPVGAAVSRKGEVKTYYTSAEPGARRRLSEALHAAGSDGAELVIVGGRAPTEILRVAERTGADIIVMGARDVHAPDTGFFGSTVERVIRRAVCPVLTLRHSAAERSAQELPAYSVMTARGK